MVLNRIQSSLFAHLQDAMKHAPNDTFVYHTEWLGYLPFGMYHWIVFDGRDVSMPSDWALDWDRQDLDALERDGMIVKIDEWTNPDDHCESRVTYELRSS